MYAAYKHLLYFKKYNKYTDHLCTNNYCEEEKKKINKLKKSLLIRIYNRHIPVLDLALGEIFLPHDLDLEIKRKDDSSVI